VKGVIFTEFSDMVEEKFSADMLDKIIDASDLPSGGSYTSVGTYDHSEIVALVTALSQETEISAVDLIHTFCGHLFERFTQMYPVFFENQTSAFDFLDKVDSYIHVEVKKLYPDAELPRISCEKTSDQSMNLMYHTSRYSERTRPMVVMQKSSLHCPKPPDFEPLDV